MIKNTLIKSIFTIGIILPLQIQAAENLFPTPPPSTITAHVWTAVPIMITNSESGTKILKKLDRQLTQSAAEKNYSPKEQIIKLYFKNERNWTLDIKRATATISKEWSDAGIELILDGGITHGLQNDLLWTTNSSTVISPIQTPRGILTKQSTNPEIFVTSIGSVLYGGIPDIGSEPPVIENSNLVSFVNRNSEKKYAKLERNSEYTLLEIERDEGTYFVRIKYNNRNLINSSELSFRKQRNPSIQTIGIINIEYDELDPTKINTNAWLQFHTDQQQAATRLDTKGTPISYYSFKEASWKEQPSSSVIIQTVSPKSFISKRNLIILSILLAPALIWLVITKK